MKSVGDDRDTAAAPAPAAPQPEPPSEPRERLSGADAVAEPAGVRDYSALAAEWDEIRPHAHITSELLDPGDQAAIELSVAIDEADRVVELASLSAGVSTARPDDMLRAAAVRIRSVQSLADDVNRMIDQVPTMTVEARRSIRVTERALEDAAEMGYIVDDGRTHVDGARAHLFDAEAAAHERRLGDAYESASIAIEMAQRVAMWAAGLPARSDRIRRGIGDAAVAVERLRAEVDGAATEIVALSDHHAERSIAEVAVYPGEAATIADEAENGLDVARAAADPDAQRWAEAEAALQDVSGILAEGRALVSVVFAYREQLARVERLAVDAVARAEDQVSQAKAVAGDMRGAEPPDVERAFVLATEARALVDDEFPDWPRALRAARAAEEASDRRLLPFRSDDERRALDAARRVTHAGALEVALARLEGYVEAHRRRIASDTLDQVTFAHDLAATAVGEPDDPTALRLFARAEAEAVGAYRNARGDVARARRRVATAFFGVTVEDGWFGPSRIDPFDDPGRRAGP